MKVIYKIYYFLIFLFFVSCSRIDKIEIYNPYDVIMKVKIDDDISFELPAKTTSSINLSVGEHKIYSFADRKLLDTIVMITPEFKKGGGYLNLTNQSVYLWSQIYGGKFVQDLYDNLENENDTIVESTFEQRYNNLEFNSVKIDSLDIFGPIKEFPKTQLTINKDWYFFIGQEFKDEIKADNNYSFGLGKTVKKLFSRDEMIIFWNNNKN